MADVKISSLPASTTPLAGTEVLPIVQGGQTRQVSVANLTAGRAVSATNLTLTGVATVPAGTVGAPSITTTGDTNTGVFFPVADTVSVATNGAERLRVDSTGNVGIGLTNPGVRLDINGTIRSIISGGTPIVYLSNGATQHSIQNTSGALTFFNNGAEAMRIHSSTGVSIGNTTNPGATNLSVTGALVVAATTILDSAKIQVGELGIIPTVGAGATTSQYDVSVYKGTLTDNVDLSLFTLSRSAGTSSTSHYSTFSGQLMFAIRFYDSAGGTRIYNCRTTIGLGVQGTNVISLVQGTTEKLYIGAGGSEGVTITISLSASTSTAATLAIKVAGTTYPVSSNTNVSARLVGVGGFDSAIRRIGIVAA